MDFTHENIKFNDDIPIKLYNGKLLETQGAINHMSKISKHWHSNIEIFYVITGKVNLWVNSEKHELCNDKIIVVNINEIHSSQNMQNGDGVLMQIPYEFVKKYYPQIDSISFACNSALEDGNNEKYSKLKGMLKEIDYVYNEKSQGYILKCYGLVFEILFELITKFSKDKRSKEGIKSRKNLDRLTRILSFIEENRKSDLSLAMVAENFKLTPQYLSKYFKNYIGITYIKYLNSIRLECAYKDLINTDLSITDIAIDNGFPDAKAFAKRFKEAYGIPPGEYRKKID